jgi:hypothetical protein
MLAAYKGSESHLMIDLAKYAAGIEADIAQLRENIEPLIYRGHKIGISEKIGQWRDITDEVISRNQRTIAIYEAILADIRGKENS